MGKLKNKNKSEVSYLRGEVKRLKALLIKKNPKLAESEDVTVDAAPDCPSCAKGNIFLATTVRHLEIYNCTVCDFKQLKGGNHENNS